MDPTKTATPKNPAVRIRTTTGAGVEWRTACTGQGGGGGGDSAISVGAATAAAAGAASFAGGFGVFRKKNSHTHKTMSTSTKYLIQTFLFPKVCACLIAIVNPIYLGTLSDQKPHPRRAPRRGVSRQNSSPAFRCPEEWDTQPTN